MKRAPVQDREPYLVPRLDGPIELDGRSNEPAWEAIEPLPLVMQIPTFRGTPTERTEIRIAYDDTHIYVAARCYDDPDGVRGTSFKRGLFTSRPDNLALILDTFDDNENAVAFFTFPTGARTDFTVFNDAEGEFPFNVDWNTFWAVEVARNGQGWFVEMRIPFSSLRFQDEDGRVEMGVHLQRYIARKHEVVGFPALERKYGRWSWAKPSLARTIVLEGIQSPRPLYVAPYAIGGLGQYAELNGSETAYETVGNGSPTRGLT
ncbi:MAG: carbohydrate binding family 9 domain-containing protein [Balneolaceae bacterium]|nr:carbohydrate binding family 9 domain-containing protein [Balneolaceae bacterium]